MYTPPISPHQKGPPFGAANPGAAGDGGGTLAAGGPAAATGGLGHSTLAARWNRPVAGAHQRMH